MEQYDFTDTGNIRDIYGLLDRMSDKELEVAREVVRSVREIAQLAQYGRHKVWFDHAPLPIFKEYAQTTSPLLQIEWNNGTIDVLSRNSGDLDIVKNYRGMYMVPIMATRIFLDPDIGDSVLALTYGRCRIVSWNASRSSCAREAPASYPP